MTGTSDARGGHRAPTLGWPGSLVAFALILGVGAGVGAVRAADDAAVTGSSGKTPVEANTGTAGKAVDKPAKTTTAKKKVVKRSTKKKATARKPIKSPTSFAKAPLPAPPKPWAAAAIESARPAVDVANSLDAGTADLAPTGSDTIKSVPAAEPALPEPSTAPIGAAPPPPPRPDALATSAVATPEVPPDPDMAVAEPAPGPSPATEAAPAAGESRNAEPTKADARVAAAQPEEPVSISEESVRIPFVPGAADLPESALQPIGELAALLSRNAGLRLQLLAYAAGTKETASQSRRLSLNRALAVRGALIDAGVRSTRIDVRALGSLTDESPTDRVDVRVMQRGG